MTICDRCGKAVSNIEWDIHTCTPKSGLCDDCETVSHCLKHGCVPKHKALEQPDRLWVGLTDEEINAAASTQSWKSFARAIEAKLKEKNA